VTALDGQPVSVAGTASALMGALQFALGGGVAALAGLTPSGQASLLSMAVVMVGAAGVSLVAFVWAVRAKSRGDSLPAWCVGFWLSCSGVGGAALGGGVGSVGGSVGE